MRFKDIIFQYCVYNAVLGVVIGLQNLGLTCYLNSLLQALSSCDIFVEWINKQKYKGQVAIAMQELVNSKIFNFLNISACVIELRFRHNVRW